MRAKDLKAGMVVARDYGSFYTQVRLGIVNDPLNVEASYVQVQMLDEWDGRSTRIHLRQLRPPSEAELEGLEKAKAQHAKNVEQRKAMETLREEENAYRTQAKDEYNALLRLFGLKDTTMYAHNGQSLAAARKSVKLHLNGDDLRKITDEYFRLAEGVSAIGGLNSPVVKRATQRLVKRKAA